MANGITRYYPQPEVVQLIFGQSLSPINVGASDAKTVIQTVWNILLFFWRVKIVTNAMRPIYM